MSKELGSRYVQAAARGDFTELSRVFSENVIFIGATPSGSWHTTGWLETEKVLRKLFSAEENISEVVSIDHHDIPGRYRISYRLRGHTIEYGQFEYEQQVYYHTEGNKISRMGVLCSGLYKIV